MDWNENGTNLVPWPKGIATIARVKVYPVIELMRGDPAKTKQCPQCGKLRAQMKLERKLDSGHAVDLAGPFPTGKDVEVPGFGVPGFRHVGFEAFMRLVPGGQWLPLARWDWPKGRAVADAQLVAKNAELIHRHGVVSAHAAHAEEA